MLDDGCGVLEKIFPSPAIIEKPEDLERYKMVDSQPPMEADTCSLAEKDLS